MEVRLAPVTARDGADTRNKDNSGKAAAGTGEVTRLGGGDQKRDAQTAAITYLLPPGAEVEGSPMNAYWTNYMRTAEAYIAGDPMDFFKFTSFKYQQGFNEADIKRECYKLGAGEEMLTIYRQFYNAYVTEYLAEPTPLGLKHALEFLADYNKEMAEQTNAAKLIQQAYKAFKAPKPKVSETGTLIAEDDREEEFVEDYGKCVKCDEPRMGEFEELCADCYWTEDARIKRGRRQARDAMFALAKRQNAIPSGDITVGFVLMPEPEVDIDALIQQAICPKQIPGWDEFWSKHLTAALRIRIPKVHRPCKCGAESTTRVNKNFMCEPCADLAQNVGECYECGERVPRRKQENICHDCWDVILDEMDRFDYCSPY
jgi:hypothetical protein